MLWDNPVTVPVVVDAATLVPPVPVALVEGLGHGPDTDVDVQK